MYVQVTRNQLFSGHNSSSSRLKSTFENMVYASARAFHERRQPRHSSDGLLVVASEHFIEVLPDVAQGGGPGLCWTLIDALVQLESYKIKTPFSVSSDSSIGWRERASSMYFEDKENISPCLVFGFFMLGRQWERAPRIFRRHRKGTSRVAIVHATAASQNRLDCPPSSELHITRRRVSDFCVLLQKR